MKNLLEGLNIRFELAEERIHELKDRSIVIMWPNEKRDERMKKNEQNLGEMWETISCTNICAVGAAIMRRERKGQKKFQSIKGWNFPKFDGKH